MKLPVHPWPWYNPVSRTERYKNETERNHVADHSRFINETLAFSATPIFPETHFDWICSYFKSVKKKTKTQLNELLFDYPKRIVLAYDISFHKSKSAHSLLSFLSYAWKLILQLLTIFIQPDTCIQDIWRSQI